MVMRVDVVDASIAAVRRPDSHVLLMAPAGRVFNQAAARALAAKPHLIFVCGHYEGVDGRVASHLVDECWSVGDYVLTGGELPAMVMIDAIARLLPGVLGNPGSLSHESFNDGLLEGPAYTRPFEYRGWTVPEVLRSGHHGRIQAWRTDQSRVVTRQLRPDLLSGPAGPEGDG